MGLKNVVVINDEAHHCYRENPRADDEETLKGDEKEEAVRTTRPRGSGFPASKR